MSDAAEMLNGALLAIGEINEAGGINGREIQPVQVSVDIDDTAAVVKGIEHLVSEDVDAISLAYSYAEDPCIYDPVAEYGCPVLTAMTSEAQAEWVFSNPSSLGSVFQVAPTERYYGVEFFLLLDELAQSGLWQPRSRKVACIETPVAAGQLIDSEAERVAERQGWTIEELIRVANRGSTWEEALDRIEQADPDAVMIAHFVPEEVARFQKLFRKRQLRSLIYCIYAPSVPEYLELAEDAAEGVLWSTATGTYGDPIGMAFRNRYRAQYRRNPGLALAGLAYDQVHLLANAWLRTDNPRVFERVTRELRRVVHRGVNGVYSLDNPRQTGLPYPFETPDPSIGQAHLVFQIQDGEHRSIRPHPYADSSFEMPPWIEEHLAALA